MIDPKNKIPPTETYTNFETVKKQITKYQSKLPTPPSKSQTPSSPFKVTKTPTKKDFDNIKKAFRKSLNLDDEEYKKNLSILQKLVNNVTENAGGSENFNKWFKKNLNDT